MRPLLHHLSAHLRLALAFAAGAAVAVACPGEIGPVSRALLGWSVGTWLYLAIVAWRMEHADQAHMRRVAEAQAESIAIVLLLVIAGAVASLAGTARLLAVAREAGAGQAAGHVALALVTVVGSWLLVPTLFSLAYAARQFEDGGLVFPDDHAVELHYTDFLYVAFTIAVASQTSDVAVTGTHMRRLVLLQSVLAFAFNTAVLAFTINLAAQMF